MRLNSRLFLIGVAAACGFTDPAYGQPAEYAPPPVDYVEAGAPYESSSQAGPLIEASQAPPQDARPARRLRVDLGGYVEVQGGVSAELGDGGAGGDDTLTYTALAAGIDGQVATRRIAASFGYRYERRFELEGNLPDADVHSGIAQVSAQLIPNTLTVEAGGIATRTGGNGGAFGVNEREAGAEVYAGYVGPNLTTRAGNVQLNAFYQLGYVNVDDDSLAGLASPEGNFNSTVHVAGASASIAPGALPVGITVSAGAVSASTSSFDSEFEGQFVRADALLPVSPSLALSAGVGYSRNRATQQDLLRDGNGAPVFDGGGNLAPDPNAPRVTAYDQDGVFADAGFVWRPTPRSELQLRAGINDDGEPLVAGSAAIQIGRFAGFSFSLYDNDETYGSNLVRNLRDLPDEFKVERDPLSGGLSAGCTFDEDRPGRGVCLSPALQSITGASFRARGGSVLFSGNGRQWNWGGGVTYARRDYHLPDNPIFADAFAPGDQDFAFFGSAGRRLGRSASIGFDGFVSLYDSEDDPRDVTTIGGRVSVNRGFLLDRLELLIALGVTHRSFFLEDSLVGDAVLGLRYVF